MNWHLLTGITAGLIQLYAIIPYVKSILKRETKPNIISWTLWTLIQLVAIWIQASSSSGFSWSVILLIAMTFNTSFVVILCLMGYGSKEFGWIEKSCLAIALIAIAFFAFTKNGPIALAFDITADFIAAIPTIIKTWRNPRSEAYGPWLIITVAAALAVFSNETFTAENLSFPIYLTCVNALIAGIAYFGRNKPKPLI